MRSPKAMAQDMEGEKAPSSSSWDWVQGYGVMGLSFSSGHILGFSRMTASSVGPPFTSVWHRDPSGVWTLFANEDPAFSSPRFFGSAVRQVMEVDIDLVWEGGERLIVTVPEARIEWALHLSADLTTRSLSWLGGTLPLWLARRRRVLSIARKMAGRLLDSGELSLAGTALNGHRFAAVPRAVWRIEASAAVVEGTDLGALGPLTDPARLGDTLIPSRGLFFRGEIGFQTLQPTDHPSSQASGGRPGEEGPVGRAVEDNDATEQLRKERIS